MALSYDWLKFIHSLMKGWVFFMRMVTLFSVRVFLIDKVYNEMGWVYWHWEWSSRAEFWHFHPSSTLRQSDEHPSKARVFPSSQTSSSRMIPSPQGLTQSPLMIWCDGLKHLRQLSRSVWRQSSHLTESLQGLMTMMTGGWGGVVQLLKSWR